MKPNATILEYVLNPKGPEEDFGRILDRAMALLSLLTNDKGMKVTPIEITLHPDGTWTFRLAQVD